MTQLFKWLASEGYVRHTPYHGVELTPRGDELATLFVRRHRLLELFLVKIMGFTLDAVDAEAEQLEHVISDAFVDRMDILLGHPTEDPHGDPIPHPLPNGAPATPFPPVQRLSDLAPGDDAVIRWVNDETPRRCATSKRSDWSPARASPCANARPSMGRSTSAWARMTTRSA